MESEQAVGHELFGAYAAGSIDPALQLLIDTQANLRSDVREQVTIAERAAGLFLEKERPAPMSFRSLERTLEMIDQIDPKSESVKKAAKVAQRTLDELIRLPEPLKEHAIDAVGKTGWKFSAPGLRHLDIDVSEMVNVRLLRIEPGYGAPRHTHEGQEYTLVVAGGFTDETGSFGPGDLSIVGPSCEHRPVADPGEVCFALAVREGGLKFTGALGVLQKFFG